MSDETFIIKQHDTRPKLVAVLNDNAESETPEPTNLTTAKAVRLIMREKGKTDKDGLPKVKDDCEVLDADKGVVSYEWKPEDTDTVGEFDAEFEVEWEDGGIETIPNNGYFKVQIVDDLG